MASLLGHTVSALALAKACPDFVRSKSFWALSVTCAVLPDADVIGFRLGVSYEAFWGHRGFTHSLFFAVLTGFAVLILFYRDRLRTRQGLGVAAFFALCTASHSLLDGLTNGGLGVAFFSPFDDARYFLPWRPIAVSPIGFLNLFSAWGARVLLTELLWVGLPCLLLVGAARVLRKRTRKS